MARQLIDLPDVNYEAEADELSWQRYCRAAQHLDVGELIDTICQEIQGDSGDSPLVHLIQGWLAAPEWDWDRPQATPMLCETLGRYVAGMPAEVVSQAIDDARLGEDA